MRPQRPSPNHIWITTWAEYDADGKLLREEGYWYEGPVAQAGGGMVPTIDQEHYRIRDDNTAADPGTPNWISTEDQATRTSIALDTMFRIRFVIANTGSGNANSTWTLRFSHNGGTYTAVAASGTAVITANATTPVDGDTLSTANFQLTAGTGTASNGAYDEDNSISNNLTAGSYTEYEFCVQLNSAVAGGISNGDTFDFIVYYDGAQADNPTQIALVQAFVPVTHTASMTGTGTVSLSKIVKKILSASGVGTSKLLIPPRVYLHDVQTLDGTEEELTVTSWSEAGTSITFTDPSGGVTGSGIWLAVKNMLNGEIGWIQVTVNGAAATPKVLTYTGTGTASLTKVIMLKKAMAGAGTVALTKQVSKNVAGSATATGALTTIVNYVKALSGSITASGTLGRVKTFLQSLAGSLTATGELTVQVQKLFTGSLTATGALTTATIFGKALAGSLTATGALLKQFQTTLSGSLTATGALTAIKTILKSLAGSLTATGALATQVQKLFTGSLTATGTLTTATTFLKALAGSLTATGALLKQFQTTLSGSLTATGALTAIKTILKSLAGSVTATGALLKQTRITLTGSSTWTGAVSFAVTYAKALAGSLTATGALLKQAQITLTGSSTWTGIVTPVFQGAGAFFQEVGGSLTATGAVFKRIPQTLTGSVTATGAVFKGMSQALAGSLTAAGTLIEQATFLQAVAGSVTATGNVFKQLQFTLAGAVTATGSLIKQARITLSGSVTATGNIVRDIGYNVSGSLAATGAMVEQLIASQAVAGSSTWTGILNGVILAPPTISAGVNAFRGMLGTFLGRTNRR